MEKNLEPIAKELFGKIRTQFPKIQLGNANSEVTDRPEDARFFKFDFSKNGVNLGTVNVDISEDDGLVVIFSNDIGDGQSSGTKNSWFNFLKELREFAKQNMMKFSIRDTTRSNLDKRDYEYLSKKNGEVAMSESKLWGTSKTSFQEFGEAKLIVKHSKPVNYDLPAGRTMHIENIYVENSQGERFRYPFKHLNGARALATHVAHGGTSYDNIGQHIIGLSEELNKLRMFKGYVDRNPVVSEAMGSINSKVYERIDQVKKEIHSLQSPTYYKSFAESFTDAEEQMIPEEIVNDWIDRLTIRSFNEELKNVFPYIYKLVGENVAPIKELTPDDLIDETSDSVQYDPVKEIEELQNFEAYINRIVSEENDLFNNDSESQSVALQKLNQLMGQELPGGADGTNAIQSLKGIIDDPELEQALKVVSSLNPEGDLRDIIKQYLEKKDEENGTDIASKITFADTPETPAPAPEPTAAAPAPETPAPAAAPAPVAERFARAVMKAAQAGMQLEDTFDLGGRLFTLKDAIEHAGLDVNQFFESSAHKQSEEVVEFIKSMFDENTGQFPKGKEGVKIAVEKEFGDSAGHLVDQVMNELDQVFESNRLRQLAGLDEQAPMMDPQAMMQQQMANMMKNPAFQKLDPNTMMQQQQQRMQQMKQQNKQAQAKMPAGQDSYTVNGKPVSKAEYDAFMAKNPQLAQNMQNPQNVVKGNPDLARIKKMAGMPTDDDW
jgi:F0F1-type ATP synthase delta subunit